MMCEVTKVHDVPLPKICDSAENDKNKHTPNWKQRVKFGLILVSGFSFILYEGSLAVAATILLVQVMCYKEILHIGYIINKRPKLPRFTLTAWYFFVVWNYCFIGEIFFEPFRPYFHKSKVLLFLFVHSRFKGFCMYLIGIILFVLNLAGKYDVNKFRLLAILHVLLIVITLPSYLLIKCLFEGMVWAVLPLSAVVLNDVFAYVFGKLYGKTPLIDLSPNKTWEGFIGGLVGTIVSTLTLSYLLSHSNHFICPTEYNKYSYSIAINSDCSPIDLFQYSEWSLVFNLYLPYSQFILISFHIALFASLIAPFAGFFASGFKRAFKIKDFSDTIPGHGGILDRFDCQFLMAIFIFVYMSTFIKNTKLKKLYRQIMNLKYDDQLEFYDLLKLSLKQRNIL